MPDLYLPQDEAARVQAKREAEQQAARHGEHFAIIRAQLAGTIMAGLLQEQYRDSLQRAEREHIANINAVKKARNNGSRINGQPQPPQLRIDIGTPARLAVTATDALLTALVGIGEQAPTEQTEQPPVAEAATE